MLLCVGVGFRGTGGGLMMDLFGSVATTSAKARIIGRPFAGLEIRLGAVRASANIE